MIDQYNTLHEQIILYNENSEHAVEKLYKLSGLLLFKILEFHPFGDGNGRLARFLTSYALSLLTPFPTPMFGIFSSSTREEYVLAFIEAHENNYSPSTLTALIIKSSYYAWKSFTDAVEMAKAGRNWKLLLATSCTKKS